MTTKAEMERERQQEERIRKAEDRANKAEAKVKTYQEPMYGIPE